MVVGISGQSGPQFGVKFLRSLRELGTVETHLVMSEGTRLTIKLETGEDADEVAGLADAVHDPCNLAAPISAGPFQTLGMAVVPCSIRSLAAIATGNSGDHLNRAAEACLKERRRLVLTIRETPLSLVHLRNMESVTPLGGTILPPVPAFYHLPHTIDDLLAQTAGKTLDQFMIEHDLVQQWA